MNCNKSNQEDSGGGNSPVEVDIINYDEDNVVEMRMET